VIASAVTSRCSVVNTPDLTGCEATMAMFDDLADNGPFWLRAVLSKERMLSIKRCAAHYLRVICLTRCGQVVELFLRAASA
jgi:hypothetical protein